MHTRLQSRTGVCFLLLLSMRHNSRYTSKRTRWKVLQVRVRLKFTVCFSFKTNQQQDYIQSVCCASSSHLKLSVILRRSIIFSVELTLILWPVCAEPQRASAAADQLSGLSLQDDEINHQSQMVEKLKEQMLDQEEVDDLCFRSFHPFCLLRLKM